MDIIFVYPKSSVAIKNGKREGTTELAHRESPDLAEDKLVLENTSSNIVNKHIQKGRKSLFILIIKNFILYIWTPH